MNRTGPGGITCESAETRCTDGGDNDGDGFTDCADSDCASNSACIPTCNRDYVYWDSPVSCPAGNKCGLNASLAPTCMADSSFSTTNFYEACGTSNKCPFGAVCVNLGEGNVCSPLCDAYNNPLLHDCPSDGLCAYLLSGTEFGLCKDVDPCNVVANTGCPLNYTCQLLGNTYCLPTSWATVPLGGDCSTDLCQGGNVCVVVGSDYRCYRACQLSSPSCSAGQSCVNVGDPTWGVCYP